MSSHANTFLPEDYLAQKAESRTNLISLILFAVVMLGVLLAFLVTNQKYSQVKKEQMIINARYQTAAEQITELTELEQQKSEMLQKAKLSGALVERVPRSILLAELINRMPDRLSLLEFHLESEPLKPAIRRQVDRGAGRMGPKRGQTKAEAGETMEQVRAPRYEVKINLVGVAPTDLEVSRYMAELNAYPLVDGVTLDYSEEKEIEEQLMRQFAIYMTLDPDADVRNVEPLILPRSLVNPMSDEMRFVTPEATVQASDGGAGNGKD
jgi:Tfp pilus assembly protein PilN